VGQNRNRSGTPASVPRESAIALSYQFDTFEGIREWSCPDPDTSKDTPREIREYFIPDFSNWKDERRYEVALQRLLGGLNADGDAR
jgi:hypothetical protein